MYVLTAADFADTGQWRLILKIRPDGLEACLENTLHKEIEPQPLCKVEWASDYGSVCKKIEETVYNNPRLLDDFATRVILYEARTLFIPKDIAEATAGSEEELYKKIYDAEAPDIMSDTNEEITAVWSAPPGVKSFLLRTFPGARITCNLMDNLRELKKKINEDPLERDKGLGENRITLMEDIREKDVDLILMQGTQLLSAATHNYQTDEDINKLENSLLAAYDLGREDLEIYRQNK